MSRIDSDKVNMGSSYVLGTSDEQMRAQALVNARSLANEIIEKAKLQAQAIVEETKNKAQKHMEDAVAQAHSQVDTITENARHQGYEKGYEEGQHAVRQDLTERIENLDKFAQSEFEIKKRIIKSAHNDIINLVIAISEKVCKKKLDIDKSILFNITKAAINELKEKEEVKIFVNPNMAQKIYEISDRLKSEILSLNSIKIVEDSSVSEDGTIVESINSRVDSRVSSQIDVIAQKLLVEFQTANEDELVREVEKGFNGEFKQI